MITCPPPPHVNPKSILLLKLQMIVAAILQADDQYEGTVETLLADGCCGCDFPGQLDITESGLWFMVWAAIVGEGAAYNDLICCVCPKTDYECLVDGMDQLCTYLQQTDRDYECGDWTDTDNIPCCSCYTPAQIRGAILRALLDWVIALGDSGATLQEAYEHGRSFNPLGSRSVNCIMYRAIPILLN